MSKPSVLPEFNTNETRTTATPTAIKSDGWIYNNEYPSEFDRPDGETFNFWMNLVYKWIKASNDLGILNYDSTTDYIVGAVATGSDGNVYQAKTANGPATSIVSPVSDTTGTWFGQFDQTIHLQEQQTAGTDAGGFTAGSWVVRSLNTEVSNTISGASLSSTKIILPIGTYRISATAPAYKVALNTARLYNETASSETTLGTSEFAASTDDAGSTVHITGMFSCSSTTTYRIEHKCGTTQAVNGLGRATNFTTEVYTNVVIQKIG